MEILRVEDVSFTYPTCEKPTVSEVSFAVNKGDFAVICGATGSGKSTLLRLLKPELAPRGEKNGEIVTQTDRIGFVMQNPNQQIVTDKVWHELAFGLENQNVPQKVMASRIAETAAYFGIESWYEKSVSELSGGQKQLLNLASVMVMQPEILILDEPTAQLDPIAASEFLSTLQKLNRELSLTVLLVEHHLEEAIPMCNRLIVLEQGKVLYHAAPREVAEQLSRVPKLLCSMPTAVRLYHEVHGTDGCPLDVREGRNWIEQHFKQDIQKIEREIYRPSGSVALEFQDVFFRYERKEPDVLRGLALSVYEKEIFCILGGNGAGKSTMLSVAAGLYKPYQGSVKVFGKKLKDYKNQSLYRECVSVLPQDVQTVFLKNTVREELEDAQAEASILPYDLTPLMEKHPYDLSGGEQQLVALAKVLATKPKLLLLDEPTKGLDAYAKGKLLHTLRTLKEQGITIVAVTHDVEFASLCADRCAMFFRGNIVAEGTPTAFFSEHNFYTTAASRMTKGYYEQAVTIEEVAELCRRNGRKEDTV